MFICNVLEIAFTFRIYKTGSFAYVLVSVIQNASPRIPANAVS
uniref:Uncharacterized protein n=1 Tax=Anguilla anguilla TaxID=7936 RepID=A0A0E9WPR8_ANGAN